MIVIGIILVISIKFLIFDFVMPSRITSLGGASSIISSLSSRERLKFGRYLIQ